MARTPARSPVIPESVLPADISEARGVPRRELAVDDGAQGSNARVEALISRLQISRGVEVTTAVEIAEPADGVDSNGAGEGADRAAAIDAGLERRKLMDRLRQQRHRARLAGERNAERQQQLEQQAHARREQRARQAEDEREVQRQRDMSRLADIRSRVREDPGASQQDNAVRTAEWRAQMSQVEREAARRRNTAQRAGSRSLRRNHPRLQSIGLCHVRDFCEATVVIGVDIVNGRHQLKTMDFECPHCHALDWKPATRPEKTRCCKNGLITMPTHEVPEEIKALFMDAYFRKNIRRFNLVFQFTSSGARVDVRLASSEGGTYTYTAHGRVYHRMGSLLPLRDDQRPIFAQIYVYDGDMARQLQARMAMHPEFGLDSRMLVMLHAFLARVNPYVKIFQTAGEYMRANPTQQMQLVLRGSRDEDITISRTRNMPVVNEVAAIVTDDEYLGNGREIVIRKKPRADSVTGEFLDSGGGLQYISEFSDAYDSLHFPVLNPWAIPGWSKNNKNGVTCAMYARYQLYTQLGLYSLLLRGGRLLQEWTVDQYAKIISNNMAYIRSHQRELRSDLYHGVLDLYRRDHENATSSDISHTGRFTILPATVVGSPRYMRKLYQDAMAIVRTVGSPDAFVTVTCNPTWEDIERELHPGERADDRPDIVARVFKQKLDAILNDLLVQDVLGKVMAYMYTIEYQKRSLPHAHILLVFFGPFKPRTAEDFDLFVSAEIPDPSVNPKLYATVRKCMLHGPCGPNYPNSPCMDPVKKCCTKKFPRIFRDTTVMDEQQVKYKRSRPGTPYGRVIYGRTGVNPSDNYVNFNGGYGVEHGPSTASEDVGRGGARTTEGGEEGKSEEPDAQLEPESVVRVVRMGGVTDVEAGTDVELADAASDAADGQDREEATRQEAPAESPTPRSRRPASHRRRGFAFDNRWVVPYNPFLSSKYNCHINVEVVVRDRAVKYIYKYIYKGSDRIDAALQRDTNRPHRFDEIRQYQDSMYICATEAAWRIFSFPMHGRSHTVVQLAVHLEEQNTIVYSTRDTVETIQARGHTTLTKFFARCAIDSEARELLYSEFPAHYVWHEKEWNPRQRGGEKAIGRMVSCSLRDAERYFMRLMLCYRRGPTSFEDLRTVDGVVYATYAQAAKVAQYVVEDDECDKCMKEAASFKMPKQLRQLFAMLLVLRNPLTPEELWARYIKDLSEDFGDHTEGVVVFKVLMELNDNLVGLGRSLIDYGSLPQIEDYFQYAGQEVSLRDHMMNRLIEIEQSYDVNELDTTIAQVNNFNDDQRVVYNTIMAAVRDVSVRRGKMFFLDGPGGTGKSYLLDTILATARRENKVTIPVATSGIAALLLKGGRTAHSRFHLPMTLDSTSTCRIIEGTADAELLKAASIIVWDEAPMMHKHGFEALDRTLRSLMGTPDLPFGGKVLLLSGDFRQILPVIKQGSRAQTVAACIKKSRLWKYFKPLRLSINMRLATAANPDDASAMRAFQDYQLEIGEGRHARCPGIDESYAQIPIDMMLGAPPDGVSGLMHIIQYVYDDIKERFEDPTYFAERAILAPWNADVDAINNKVIEMIPLRDPAHERVYQSFDSVDEREDMPSEMYPAEFLNTLEFSGVPAHKLRLRVGGTVMLMRNISGDQGLCNGTRMRVMALEDNCIDVMIITGSHRGNRVALPRMELTTTDSNLPFQLKRRQFPVKLAFAMTINKAQGQSVQNLGLYLPRSVFSHGQLYVAISRVTSRSSIKVFVENHEFEDADGTYTRNVVYDEIFHTR